ncbi:DsrE family protein [Novosphingobium sp. ZN18A2]|uniref:DsrE family protein n=1 Tax=Novosphingobium sp. ZN18A2 TaxID=3079861 RepID=UPI0030D22A1C
MHKLMIAALAAAAFAASPAMAQDMSKFHEGPVFKDFGKIADVESDMPIPPGTVLKAMFEEGKGADPGKVNRTFDSIGRYINMNVAAGVPEDYVQVALVVHGTAGFDVTNAAAYAKKYPGKENPNAPIIAALLAHGVKIYICGQSSAALGIAKADLLPGVKMALSAMTAETLLQQQGYHLIP